MKEKKQLYKISTMRFALQVWCLQTPPPRMIIPEFTAYIAWLFIRRTSAKVEGYIKRLYQCIIL